MPESGDRRKLDASGSTVADRDLAVLDNGRHLVDAPVELEHLLHPPGIGFHIEVFDLGVLVAIVLTGGRGVRSTRLSENQYLRCHTVMLTDQV